MADSVCDGEQQVKPAPKRRRILDPAAIVSVPVYSNKVSSSLRLTPMTAVFTDQENSDEGLWSRFSSRIPVPNAIDLSISEEDDDAEPQPENVEHRAASCCPSPPVSPVQKQSRKVTKKISELNRKLRAVSSLLLSPESQDRKSVSDEEDDDEDDDVIVISPACGPHSSPYSSAVREIPLKVRCRTDVHKIPVLSSTPLSDVLTQLSVILSVPPPRLLLLREEAELPTGATVGELGLGIADIIECVVMAAAEAGGEAGGEGGAGSVTVRLQSKDRDAAQEFTLPRDAPLGSIFSLYLSRLSSSSSQQKVRFHFDGNKLTSTQTPQQLDMEDGDIIEVWV
ncbi:NFATC2-interacting protein [Clinocottus analis]|uniref:NFATC2-interacting protein n=1 Tax=Clinocottus analis TaxID=304258 RepID=UPI0035C0176C